MFLKITQNLQENTCVGVSFLTLLKETLAQVFSYKFCVIFTNIFLYHETGDFRWLLLQVKLCLIRKMHQSCVQDPCKHLRWRALQQQLGLKAVNCYRKLLHLRCLRESWRLYSWNTCSKDFLRYFDLNFASFWGEGEYLHWRFAEIIGHLKPDEKTELN